MRVNVTLSTVNTSKRDKEIYEYWIKTLARQLIGRTQRNLPQVLNYLQSTAIILMSRNSIERQLNIENYFRINSSIVLNFMNLATPDPILVYNLLLNPSIFTEWIYSFASTEISHLNVPR